MFRKERNKGLLFQQGMLIVMDMVFFLSAHHPGGPDLNPVMRPLWPVPLDQMFLKSRTKILSDSIECPGQTKTMSSESPTQYATATPAPDGNKSGPSLHSIMTFVARMICAGNDMDPSPNEAALMRKVVGLLELNKNHTHGPGSLISRCKAIVSPIRRVPTEIWARIFEECLWEDEDFITVDRDEAPLNISWVCRRWRAIVLSMPSLWRSIAITRNLALNDCYPSRELVSLWLARSAPYSISFSFVIEEGEMDTSLEMEFSESFQETKRNSPDQQILVNELLECMSRWKSVCFDLPFLDGWDLDVPERGALLLESVKVIKGTTQSLLSLDPFIHRIWENAPRLHNFSLCDTTESCRKERNLLTMPYGLTELKINYGLSLKECWIIFWESPELTVCDFGRVSGDNNLGNTVKPVFLPKLRSLMVQSTICTFNSDETSNLTNVLTLITAPNFQKFGMRWDNGYLHEPLVSFIVRSNCALTELILDYVPISEGEMKEVLELISGSIRTLRVDVGYRNTPFGKDLFQSLTWRGPDKKFLCPNLEIISFNSSVIGERDSLFVKMVESRWYVDDGRIQLKEVKLDTRKERGQPPFDQLERFSSEGLVLKVFYEINSDTEDEDTE